jgi:DNA primase
MAGYIPQDVIEEVRSRADIVEVISGYIPLKKSGRNFKALCPFHNEKTSSFMVSPAKQIFHCFGCGVGGNVFNFVMMQEHLSFHEAIKKIANKVGVKLPETTKKNLATETLFNRLLKANELAMLFFHKQLLEARAALPAKTYLKSRDFNRATAENFKLGFASSEWSDLFQHLLKEGISDKVMVQAGLISLKQGGGYCDRFRNRLMFPIFNSYDKVIGFGARVLNDGQMPKYLNSPDTPVFSKGKNLYGLNLAKKSILEKDRVIIVEGYTDCIRAHENGFKETVATLGTALTVEQARSLKRYTNSFILIYDADEAGELAALRNLDVLLPEGITPRIAVLPKNTDPDEYLRNSGIDNFKRIIESTKNIFDYKLQLLFKKYDASLSEDKVKITDEFLPTLSLVPNSVLKSTYIRKLAESLDVREGDIISELAKFQKSTYRPEIAKSTKKKKIIELAEKILLVIMLEDNAAIGKVKSELSVDDFISSDIRPLISKVFEHYDETKKVEPAALIDELDDEDSKTLVTSIFLDMPELKDRQKNLSDCIISIKKRCIESKINKIKLMQKEAQQAKNSDKAQKLSIEADVLIKQKNELAKIKLWQK